MNSKNGYAYFLLVISLNGMLGNLIGYFLPIYFKQLGFSGFQIGLYFSVTSIATILMSLPMGISTDRISITKILVGSFFLMGLSKFGFVISHSFIVFCLFSFLGSFGGRFNATANTSLFFKITGKDNRNEAGVYQLVQFVSMGVGMIAGAFLIARSSFHVMFIFAFAATWVLMALALLLPRNQTVTIKIEEYKKAVFSSDVIFIAVVFALSSIHGGAEQVSYGPFLREVLGLKAGSIGLYTGVGFMFVGIGAYLGVLLLRFKLVANLQRLLMLGFLLSGLCHILMTIDSLWWSFGFRLIHEIGDGMVYLGYYNGIAKIFHLDKIGGCAAFISLWMSLSSFMSSMIFGVIGSTFGHQWPLIISGVILALLPLLMYLRGGHLMKDQVSAEADEYSGAECLPT